MSREPGKVLIFRTTRRLRDGLVMRAAERVLEGRVSLGAGATYSVNNLATEVIAEALGVEWKKENAVDDSKYGKIGISFRFPIPVYEALAKKAKDDDISINEEISQLLERNLNL